MSSLDSTRDYPLFYVCLLVKAPDSCISPNPLQAGTCLSWPADPTCLPAENHTEFLSVVYWGQVGGTVGVGGVLGALMRKLHTGLPDTWSLSVFLVKIS